MNDNQGFTSGQILLAFLGGAAAGATVAYLTAPRAGSETRELIAEGLRSRGEQYGRKPKALRAAYSAAAEAARDAFNQTYQAELDESAKASNKK